LVVTNWEGGRGPLVLLVNVGVGVSADTRRALRTTCPRRDSNMGDKDRGRKTRFG